MNPLSLLLAVLRATLGIVLRLFGSRDLAEPSTPAVPSPTVDPVAAAALRRARRERNARRREQRARRRRCNHGRPTRCGPRSRRRRAGKSPSRPSISASSTTNRPAVLEVRRSKCRTEWEVVRQGTKLVLLTSPSKLAAMEGAGKLLEKDGGGELVVLNETGKVAYEAHVSAGWWFAKRSSLPNLSDSTLPAWRSLAAGS